MDTLKIFCSYAPADKGLMEQFHAHLRRVLELQHVSIRYTHNTPPGRKQERERDSQLHSAQIILFLVSSDFMSSQQYEKEVLPAMERYSRGETRVIPIILRPVHWKDTAFGQLSPLPDGGKPVTDDSSWKTLDHAFFNVVSGIKRVIDDEKTRQPMQEKNHDLLSDSSGESTSINHEAFAQLEQIIQNFKLLRGQISSYVRLNGPKGFTIESCESQYNKLYGDTMVFLATYLPECVSDNSEGFVEMVYRKATEQLRRRGDIFVALTRLVISPLAKLEKLAEQIDACTATLELYKQRYFPDPHF